MDPKRKKINLLGWTTIVIGTVVVIGISYILYRHTVSLLTTNLRQRIESIARAAAPAFDPEDIEDLQMESDWEKPAWKRVVTELLAVEKNNPDILFAYIFRKKTSNPLEMEFVADSHSLFPYANRDDDPTNNVDANRDGKIEPDGPDLLQWPGQDYPEPPEGTFRAYTGPTTSKELYEDSFGRVITGYMPIVRNGEIIAVVAFDLKADDFFSITRQTLYPFLGFISALVLIILLLFSLIIKIWNRQLHIVEAADRMKTQFLSFASHQVKSPMTVVKDYADLIRDGSYGAIPDKVKETATKIHDSADRLIDLVNDLLDLRKLEEGKIEYNFTQVDVGALLKNTFEELKTLADAKHLEMTLEAPAEPTMVKADESKLRQVFQNLIDNSVKYTESGWIKIKLYAQSSTLKIEISDSGLGIPQDLLSSLFEQFQRGSKEAKKIQGTGLGLYIAKQFVLAHGGTVTAASDGPGKGSTFTVELPKS